MSQDSTDTGEAVYLGSFSDAGNSSNAGRWARVRTFAGYGSLMAATAGASFLISYPIILDLMGKR
jgi:hypothetical protein